MYVFDAIGRDRKRTIGVENFHPSANQVNPSVLHDVGSEGAHSNLLNWRPSRRSSRRGRLPRRDEGREGTGGTQKTKLETGTIDRVGEVGNKGGVSQQGGARTLEDQ